MSTVRKPTLLKKDSPPSVSCDTLPPEIADAIRAIVRHEHEQIRREEDFRTLRALKSKQATIEERLK